MHNITALINNIWIYDKDMLGSSFGSFDGLTYEKKMWVHFHKIS